MVKLYDPIYHENSTDDEEEILKLHSSREEPKTLEKIIITGWVNEGILRIYHMREKLGEIPVGGSTLQVPLEIPVELEIPEGEDAKLTLQNRISGTNAKLIGHAQYIIR